MKRDNIDWRNCASSRVVMFDRRTTRWLIVAGVLVVAGQILQTIAAVWR